MLLWCCSLRANVLFAHIFAIASSGATTHRPRCGFIHNLGAIWVG